MSLLRSWRCALAGGVYKYSAPPELAIASAFGCSLGPAVTALKKEPGRENTINVLPLLRADAEGEGLASGLFRPLLTILRRSLLSRAFANDASSNRVAARYGGDQSNHRRVRCKFDRFAKHDR